MDVYVRNEAKLQVGITSHKALITKPQSCSISRKKEFLKVLKEMLISLGFKKIHLFKTGRMIRVGEY